MKLGVADAARLCEVGEVPSSKIYSATEKLSKLGLISVQRSRPRQFAALSVQVVADRVGELAREQANQIASGAHGLVDAIRLAQGEAKPASAYADVVLGRVPHVQRHVALLASAQRTIVSYLESPDIEALYSARDQGVNVLRSVRKNAEARRIQHRIVFGFGPRDGKRLISFLKDFSSELRSATAVRYAGLLGHPFHIVDDELVILGLDNPFLPERRYGSLMMRSADLGGRLSHGFEELWNRSITSLREVHFDPRA